jgi:hypothetical protein
MIAAFSCESVKIAHPSSPHHRKRSADEELPTPLNSDHDSVRDFNSLGAR